MFTSKIKKLLADCNIIVNQVEDITSGVSSQIYEINDKYILKVNKKYSLDNEEQALLFLKKNNFPVPSVIKWCKGLLLINKIKGKTLTQIKPTPEDYIRIGKVYKRLHNFKYKINNLDWQDQRIRDSIESLDIPEEIKQYMLSYKLNKESYFLHGDPARGNILVDKDNVSLIDFEWAHSGPPAKDIAKFLQKHEQKYYKYFFQGYGKIPKDTFYFVLLFSIDRYRHAVKHNLSNKLKFKKEISTILKKK